jgi:hypothetical protein
MSATVRCNLNYVRTGAFAPKALGVTWRILSKKTARRSPLAAAPSQRALRMPPKHGRVPLSPHIDPMATTPAMPAPRQRPPVKVPNPRRPKVVRVVGGGELRDLFEVFPDLPGPPRSRSRLATRVISRHRRHHR